MRRWIGAAAAFCYDFVVGDDWRMAATVVLALALTGLAVAAGLPAWPVTPVLVVAALVWSTCRASRDRTRP